MIMFTPTLKNLRLNFKNAHIALFLINKYVSGIIKKELVDEIIILPRNFVEIINVILELRREHFDLSFTVLPRTYSLMKPLVVLITALISAKIRVGHCSREESSIFRSVFNCRVYVDEDKHEVERDLDLLRSLNLPIFTKTISIPCADNEEVSSFFMRHGISDSDFIIGIHSGAGTLTSKKCWPISNFIEMSKILIRDCKAKIIIVGGNKEAKVATRISETIGKNAFSAAGQFTLSETAAIIKKCKLFITNDSGPMHIAVAVKTPVIAIFGPTDPVKNAPYNIKHLCIVNKKSKCRPCYQDLSKIVRCKYPHCIKSITTKDVIKGVFLLKNQL
ncbi:MAG: glycosyltransferase family 9 protein [Candidatus Baldrarchaeia archaeon]